MADQLTPEHIKSFLAKYKNPADARKFLLKAGLIDELGNLALPYRSLSPAADAIYEAYCTEADRLNREVSDREMLAAAPMNPQEAGFDGAEGIGLNNPNMTDGGVFRLRRGSTPPWKTTANYQNQLFWHQSTPPRLLYCNNVGKWFELSFTPIQTQ